ncbi:MAG: single-stranded DNA-binding protein [Chloroflexi bacterium]|jgi:single-strand DNA-binding protein|nr:single-stranded DNA-binding protein [Chloroflexota bacterium]MDL1885298.1 single-stranded DNA-binding protein [Anaerolineae bacterium CFX8]
MAGYAYTVIVGNVGRDPEMRYTGSGVPVCSFSVAVTERWTDRQTNERKEKTTWYRISAWRGLAETCNTYVKKGMQILVTGTVSASAYQGQDGQPAATLELTARDVQFLGSRADREGGSEGGYEDFAPPDKMDDIPF